MKNITLSANEKLIEQARKRASSEDTTLNNLFREWLDQYAAPQISSKEYKKLMKKLSYARAGRKFTREEMNER